MLFQLAIEGRAADPKLARHRRHLAAVTIEREFYGFGFQATEMARIAVLVEERQHIGIAHDPNELSFAGPRGQDRRRRDANGKTLDLCRDLRKLGDAELKAIGEHHGAKDGVFELADVPRPVESAEQPQRLRRYRANATRKRAARLRLRADG